MRSLLFVPADSSRKLEKSLGTEADALIFDLEDSVAESRKAEARTILTDFLRAHSSNPNKKIFVRVNALSTAHTLSDLSAVMPCRPYGVVLPKCSGIKDIDLLSNYLDVYESLYPSTDNEKTKIIAVATETAKSIFGLQEYGAGNERLFGLMWGAEDLSGDVGALTRTQEGYLNKWSSPFELVRSMCLYAAAAAGVIAIDTVPTEINNPDALTEETRRAFLDGFSAKAAIHPKQVAVINKAMMPDAQRLDWAQRVVQVFAESADLGVVQLDGKMLDMPHLKLAKKIINAAGIDK